MQFSTFRCTPQAVVHISAPRSRPAAIHSIYNDHAPPDPSAITNTFPPYRTCNPFTHWLEYPTQPTAQTTVCYPTRRPEIASDGCVVYQRTSWPRRWIRSPAACCWLRSNLLGEADGSRESYGSSCWQSSCYLQGRLPALGRHVTAYCRLKECRRLNLVMLPF